MILLRRAVFAMAFLGQCLPGHADSQGAMLQITIDLGERPVTRLLLALQSRPLEEAPGLSLPVVLPLYSRHGDETGLPPLQAAEDNRTFCEKSRAGCIALASLIGIGIYFVVTQYEHDSKNTRTTVTFTSGQTAGQAAR